VLLRQVDLALLLKTRVRVALAETLYWGHSLVSCWVRLRCDGMGLGRVGWS
jgi:hypothetical protein